MGKTLNIIYYWISICFVGFHLYTAAFGVMPGIGQKAIHLGFVIFLFFLGQIIKEGRSKISKYFDFGLLIMGVSSVLYVLKIDATLDLRAGITYKADIVFGIFLILVLIEACRRSVGLSLSIIVTGFIAYGFLGRYMPGFLAHAGFNVGRFVHLTVLTSDGIFGTALYASAVYIVLFIILGAVFNETGVGDYFTNVATALFGKMKGGPAKVAVIASGFFGSISGSAIANVIGTGTFTIPLMKKSGFEPEVAGGVEAAASTGGQIMPPIMGTTAFLAAEMLGISYFEFIKAAFIPAILFFVGIIMMIDLYARRKDIQGIDEESIPSAKELIRKIYLFLPLVFLVVLLSVLNFTITKAGIYAIVFTIVLVMFNPETRMTKQKMDNLIIASVSGSLPVGIACAIVGIIVAMVMGSGLGFRMSSILVDLAQGRLIVLLILTMIVSIILGMGVPTTAAYLLLAVLVAPAMVKMGVQPVAAHLFIFYYGIISNITPPVALAAYAAAGIAKCNPNKTGIQAFRLSLSGFILPFMFVYNSTLLMQGEWYRILIGFISALVGVYCLSSALEKFTIKWEISLVEQIALFCASLLLISSTITTDIIGYVIISLVIGFRMFISKKEVVNH